NRRFHSQFVQSKMKQELHGIRKCNEVSEQPADEKQNGGKENKRQRVTTFTLVQTWRNKSPDLSHDERRCQENSSEECHLHCQVETIRRFQHIELDRGIGKGAEVVANPTPDLP